RQKATRELEQLGEEAEGPLRRAVIDGSAETRRRAGRILQNLEAGGRRSQTPRRLPAVGGRESLWSAEARPRLPMLAGGPPDARLTVEAQTAIKRMSQDGLTKR